MKKAYILIFTFSHFFTSSLAGALASGAPTVSRDGERVDQKGGCAGCDSFVNDPAGSQQREPVEFNQGGGYVVIFVQALDEACCSL